MSDQCHMTMPGIDRVTVLCPAVTQIRRCGILHCYAVPLPCQTNKVVSAGWLVISNILGNIEIFLVSFSTIIV